MRKLIIILIVAVLVLGGIGAYFFLTKRSPEGDGVPTETATTTSSGGEQTGSAVQDKTKSVIGNSVQDREIIAYHYGEGDQELLFVGGIHGGYEWNTTLAAYELMDYLKENPAVVPANVKVTVIPVLNPDGLYKTVGTAGRFTSADVPTVQSETIPGRFNANNVDLNRNFDCDWQSNGTWQKTAVSGGTAAFSEPESQAFKSYIEAHTPTAVVVWYSAAGGVFASSCHNGVSTETRAITSAYAKASGYKAYEDFNFYEITGDMVNWLAKEGVPAISILLTTHEDTEWVKNKAGVEALLKYYAK